MEENKPRIVSQTRDDDEKYVKLTPKERAKVFWHTKVASKYARKQMKERAGRFVSSAGETVANALKRREGKGSPRYYGENEGFATNYREKPRKTRRKAWGTREKRGYDDLIGGDFGGVGGFGRFGVGFNSKKGGKKKWSSLI